MKGRDYWRNEMAKGVIRAQGGDIKILEDLLDEIESLEKNQLTPVAADKAICSAKYHLALAEKGDTRCGVCGSPLRR